MDSSGKDSKPGDQPSGSPIRWRLHLASSPAAVYQLLATDQGRARFWAESAIDTNGWIDWRWPGGLTARTRIHEASPPHRFSLEYLGGSLASFELTDDGADGTDLTLTDAGVREADYAETHAGWVSVLLALKAAADHDVDLRNHDEQRTWDQGFVDN